MKKIVIFIISIVFIISVFALIYYFKDDEISTTERVILDELPKWEYKLDSNATPLIRSEFASLKSILTAEEINDEEYASSIAKLFIAELFTLDNKLNQYDVGGEQYVLPSILDNYRLNVQNTIYRYLEDNTSGNRTQELPEVSEVKIIEQKPTEYKIGDVTYEAYNIELSWDFVNDMGYDDKGEVILVKDGIYFYVVEKNRSL